MEYEFEPTQDRILVEPLEEKAPGVVQLPDSAKNKPMKGMAVAVGPGLPEEPMTIAPGDSILYRQFAGQEVLVNSKKYLVMRLSDVLGSLKKRS